MKAATLGDSFIYVVVVKGLGAAQKGQNREGLSPEMHTINTGKFHFHMSMHDRGEMGKWGWPNRIQQHT